MICRHTFLRSVRMTGKCPANPNHSPLRCRLFQEQAKAGALFRELGVHTLGRIGRFDASFWPTRQQESAHTLGRIGRFDASILGGDYPTMP